MTPNDASALHDQALDAASLLDAVRQPWWVWGLVILGSFLAWGIIDWLQTRGKETRWRNRKAH